MSKKVQKFVDKLFEELKESNPKFKKNLEEITQISQKVSIDNPVGEKDRQRLQKLNNENNEIIRAKLIDMIGWKG